LIERSATGSPFQVVAASEKSDVGSLIAPFGVRLMSLSEMARSADIDLLWVTSFWEIPFDCSPSELFRQQHLIAEAPFTLGDQAAGQAFADAARQGRLLLIHHPRRSDLEFRHALAVARDETIGAIRAVKFVSWSYGRAPRGATRGVKPPAGDEYAEPGATLVRFVAHALDQMVVLIPSRPISVWAAGDPRAGAADLFAGDSLSLRIVFESGCQAEIDIRLDSPTPYQSGWILTGERGGHVKGRQYTLTAEGEVFDSPVSTADTLEATDQFEWLARQIRSGVADAEEEVRARSVVALLEAAQRSLATSQSVRLS
jgi:predicted dehydrogenase